MLTIGLVLLGLGIVAMAFSGFVTSRQIKRAGGDPSQGEFAYAAEGGVTKRTSTVMLSGWLLLIVGAVLTVIALL